MTRWRGKFWSRTLWTGRSPAATQAWDQRERTGGPLRELAFDHQRLLLPIWPRPQALQPGVQASTEGQGTPAATGHGPYSLPVTLGNDISSNKDTYESGQYKAGEDC